MLFFPLLTHNQSGKTALQVAEEGGHTQLVELLKKAVLTEQEQTKTGKYTKREIDCEFLLSLIDLITPLNSCGQFVLH